MEFPENKLGITRGTVLEAIHPAAAQLGMSIGDKVPVGFDGEYVRSGPFGWSIEQLVAEIEEHQIWRIADQVDLSDPLIELPFVMVVECGQPSPDLVQRARAAAIEKGLIQDSEG